MIFYTNMWLNLYTWDLQRDFYEKKEKPQNEA